MNFVTQFIQYLKFIIHAKDEHSVHSPLVFDLYTNIIKERKPYYIFANIESVRAKLLLSSASIDKIDFGTGSSSRFRISKIADKSLKKPKEAELLFRLVNYFNPENILEIGTSLGITTAYLASVRSGSHVDTLEGCPETAKIASQTFETLRLNNIRLHVGEFEHTLDKVISTIPSLDFVFMDGNHRKEPTLRYFESCLKAANDKTILVIDDIHWSTEMNEAWEIIKSDKKVSISIDLFNIGIIFLDPSHHKQDYILRY